jgi:ferrous iron transport protein B
LSSNKVTDQAINQAIDGAVLQTNSQMVFEEKWVALVGAPNSGKTTLYNWLTGSKFKTVNYPGATVDVALGKLHSRWKTVECAVVDTPGTYSLFPKSEDESITVKTLFEKKIAATFPVVVCVVDGTQLARHLLTLEQLKEAGFKVIVAITMSDILNKSKLEVDANYLREHYQMPVVFIDGVMGAGVLELASEIERSTAQVAKVLPEWNAGQLSAKQAEIEKIASRALNKNAHQADVYAHTASLDRWLLHPIFGILFFVLIMSGLFASIFYVAAPFMDMVDALFGSLNEYVVSLAPEALWTDFLGNGIVAGVGSVLIFVPQILILFLVIGFLEGSGYLARAATLIDKPFSKVGLSGRSFVPVLSGFACAIPALMASRNISSSRDRWITNFIVPLMQCSARLPVFALLLGFIFKDQAAWKPGLALALIYFGGLLLGATAAAIVNRMLPSGLAPGFFMMELPIYRFPKIKVLAKHSLNRTMAYVKRAGPPIFIFAVLIWLGATFPHHELPAEERLSASYLGQAGQVMEPVFKPMGVDWRVGVGLISAFAAREVFVSAMAVVFQITSEDEEGQIQGLLEVMSQAQFPDGSLIFTFASAVGLIVFFMIALQCTTTVAMAAKEMHSWKFAIGQLIAFNLIAYVLAVLVVKGLRLSGIA